MKKEEINQKKEFYRYFNTDRFVYLLMKLLLIILVITSMIRIAETKTTENKLIYDKCIDGCSAKHFIGLESGVDSIGFKEENTHPILEFDRTTCINNCNLLYLRLKTKEG